MRRFTKVLIVLCCLGMLGLFGSFAAMQPSVSGEAATGYTSFEHLLAELAKFPAPDSAEALPPAPHTGCVGLSNIMAKMEWENLYATCATFVTCPPIESVDVQALGGEFVFHLSSSYGDCMYCINHTVIPPAFDEGRASYQNCMTLSTYCSEGNPWC